MGSIWQVFQQLFSATPNTLKPSHTHCHCKTPSNVRWHHSYDFPIPWPSPAGHHLIRHVDVWCLASCLNSTSNVRPVAAGLRVYPTIP